ncbi:hypothetical protein OQH61_01985 [Helicobacter sp. MIT 21-1697]|uniref:hypothetical protein n=1 Tax=Helicobacter sp. MIT 21-1697 TaxID=2993733 RepID=UPI00224AC13E|nr:hypothetical protein [Helicobacter sp. MIT 21-1697]MCX2716501.1 hypothetical protein [Helicobacter sp. MIT 21-1697]
MGFLKSIKKRIARFKSKCTNALTKSRLDSTIRAFLDSKHIGVVPHHIGIESSIGGGACAHSFSHFVSS